jgi:peptidyl-prolyl cis-trans isomerase C
MSRRLAVLACSALLASCGGEQPAEPAAAGELPPGFVARAGTELIATPTVARIAHSQGISPKDAALRALSDAVLAAGARASLPRGTIASIERGAQARRTLEALAADATRRGPPSAAELEEQLRERWVELDRPAAARTVHAVVLSPKPEREQAARAVAEKMAEAVRVATSAEDFIKIAKEAAADGFEVRAEPLPFITVDGRGFQRRDSTFVAQGSFDEGFAAAANALDAVGQLSPIVQTRFGFHIIRLEERAPAAGIPEADRPSALTKDVMSRRAERARRELLDRLRQSSKIELDRAVDELTARVQKAP